MSNRPSFRIEDRKSISVEYKHENCLGKTLSSSIYKGSYRNESCAIKKYHATSDFDDKGFMREVSSLCALQHENIVKILGYFVPHQDAVNQHFLLVMEIAELDLAKVIYPLPEKDGSTALDGLDPWTMYNVYVYNYMHVIHWAKQMASALHFLRSHDKQIVHRDLKPENILMFPKTIDGEVFNFYTCKITDFNSSTFMKNQTQSCRGSSGFMAPELEYSSPNSSEVISPALDVFSFGKVFFAMIDRSPGDIEARGFANDCNPRVRRLYDRCTCRSAKDRLAPLDILEELDEWVEAFKSCDMSVEIEKVQSFRVKFDSSHNKCFYIMNTEAVPNEQVGECKTSDTHGGLRLTFESVNKELQDKVEMNKQQRDQEQALKVLLQEFGLVDAYQKEERVRKAVTEHLTAQSYYQKQLALKKRDDDLKTRMAYLKANPDELMRALHVKKEELDGLIERKAILTEKILTQYMKCQMQEDDESQSEFYSHNEQDERVHQLESFSIPESLQSSSRR